MPPTDRPGTHVSLRLPLDAIGMVVTVDGAGRRSYPALDCPPHVFVSKLLTLIVKHLSATDKSWTGSTIEVPIDLWLVMRATCVPDTGRSLLESIVAALPGVTFEAVASDQRVRDLAEEVLVARRVAGAATATIDAMRDEIARHRQTIAELLQSIDRLKESGA